MLSEISFAFGISDVFSFLIVLIVIYVTKFYHQYFTRTNPLPGPLPLPLIGNAHQQIGMQYKDWLESLHETYGDMFEFYIGGQRSIVLCRTDLIENMFLPTTKTKYPFKFIVPKGFAELGIDDTGLTSNNNFKSWKYHRQFFTQAMLIPSFNHQAIEWTNELFKEMETYWNNLGEVEMDIVKWMRRFMNETVFLVSTGVKNDAIFSYYSTLVPEKSFNEEEKKKIEESENFIQSIQTFSDGLIHFVVFNWFVRHYVPFLREKTHRLLKNKEYLTGRIMKVINERRIEIENTPLDQPLRHDMLTSFITANTSRDVNSTKQAEDPDLLRPMTNREIHGNIFGAMRAGTDTTSNLFCFVVYHLEHYPEVKQRLRQELDTVLGKDLTKPITMKEIDELHYCEAVINEVARLRPVVPVNSRVNSQEDEIGGFIWPEGTSFRVLHSVIMKRKDYWTDPEKFDPNRFYKIEESDKYLLEKKHAKTAFSIFGGGIRICPGRKLAMIELKFFLSSVYRKYDFELADMNAPLSYQSSLIASCKELIAKVKPRKF